VRCLCSGSRTGRPRFTKARSSHGPAGLIGAGSGGETVSDGHMTMKLHSLSLADRRIVGGRLPAPLLEAIVRATGLPGSNHQERGWPGNRLWSSPLNSAPARCRCSISFSRDASAGLRKRAGLAPGRGGDAPALKRFFQSADAVLLAGPGDAGIGADQHRMSGIDSGTPHPWGGG
jgi:hypothetical protein